MYLINKINLIVPIVALSTIFVPMDSNAQFVPDNCNQQQNIDYLSDIDSEKSKSVSCIQDYADTIYNPHSEWQTNL